MRLRICVRAPFFAVPRSGSWGRLGGQLRDVRRNLARISVMLILFLGIVDILPAVTGGSISGTIKDPTGAVISGAIVTLRNIDLTTKYTEITNSQGFYSFPNVPAGHYQETVEATGFSTQKRDYITVDTDSAIVIDSTLQLGADVKTVTVTATESGEQAEVETVATQLGEVVADTQIESLPLNGRSYTDLLAIQPGVSPVTTLTPTSVIMSGVTGTLNPSGDLNPGDVSINGQRESANGFMVNGTDVQEFMNGGTSIIPNLDSIREFRVLTTNFDPEYGNYNGGMINVVTKSGSNSFHGDAFEFLRNTALDAKNYFDSTRGVFRQNQFGGTLGGPAKKDKIFFFGDYQGTRTVQGETSPVIQVPSLQDRMGNLSDVAGTLTGDVSGPAFATILDQKLGYAPGTVQQGEPYYTPNCTSPTQCVLPGAQIPAAAWSTPAQHLLQYIPQPNLPANQFSTSAEPETVRDDKLGVRTDINTRWGQFSGYYFLDNYRLNNPYPAAQGGANVPGFDALTFGQAQLYTLGYTRLIGPNTVNEFHAGLIRNHNNIGQPNGGKGVTLASQGFATGPHSTGIDVQAPQFEGVENIVFPTFIMGVTITGVNQWNNALYLSDSVSRVAGNHTLKFGAQFHGDQVNEKPNATFNGTFNILGTETGNAFADFLLGVPSNFTQSTGASYYLRNRYFGAFGEDSWRVRSDLTLNIGVRWDVIRPWSEKYNNIQTVIPGKESTLYPNAIPGLLVAGDPGVPSTLSPTRYGNLAPRIGVAYTPNFSRGPLHAVFGSSGESSIRASYGMFYTAFPGLSAGIMYSVPPFGYNYLSPAPPLFAQPFVNAGDGAVNINPYPFTFPPHSVSAKNPDAGYDWAAVTPISADPYWYYQNVVPYAEDYMLSFQRQLTPTLLLTVSYVGNQGHHTLVQESTNPGNAALCLALSHTSQVAAGSTTCGPYGEDGTYTSASGQVYAGTRNIGLGSNPQMYGLYGEDTAQRTIGNSNYNSLETNLRYAGGRSSFLLSYTYSKSIDQASNIGEQLDPFDPRHSRTISAWDMPQDFVATYRYTVPFERIASNRFTDGWSLSGSTRFATGFPVTLTDDSDNSLLGTLGNGVNNLLLDTPKYNGAPLNINNNPRTGRPEVNLAAFSPEPLGVLGNAKRRIWHGPGISNFDLTLEKTTRLTESKSFVVRVEAFNVFNHAQFYGPAAVDGEINDPEFGHVVSAQAPRLIQLAAKFMF